AELALRRATRRRHGGVCLRECPPRAVEERCARLGQLDLAAVAQEKRRADFLLELADGDAERRVWHGQTAWRPAGVQLLGHGQEVASWRSSGTDPSLLPARYAIGTASDAIGVSDGVRST